MNESRDEQLHNREAEAAVLGTMMVSKTVIPAVAAIIKSPDAFVTTDHQIRLSIASRKTV